MPARTMQSPRETRRRQFDMLPAWLCLGDPMQFGQLERRHFIALLGGTAVAWPLAARAQQTKPMPRIGVLMSDSENDPEGQASATAMRNGLAELGWTNGRNVRIDYRWASGDAGRAREFAKELVDLRPDVILGRSTPVITALLHETRTIPIVFTTVSDPIGSGFIASLGNILPTSIRTRRQVVQSRADLGSRPPRR